MWQSYFHSQRSFFPLSWVFQWGRQRKRKQSEIFLSAHMYSEIWLLILKRSWLLSQLLPVAQPGQPHLCQIKVKPLERHRVLGTEITETSIHPSRSEFVPGLSCRLNIPFHSCFLKKQDLHSAFGNKTSPRGLVPSQNEVHRALKFLQLPESIWDSLKRRNWSSSGSHLSIVWGGRWQCDPESVCVARVAVQPTQSPRAALPVPPPSLPEAQAGLHGHRRKVGIQNGRLQLQALLQWGLLEGPWWMAVMCWVC